MQASLAPSRPKARARLVLILVIGLSVWDLSRPPESQLSARAMLGVIRLYRQTLSPRMPSLGVVCRFEPSCSRYAEVSIRRYGAARGFWRSAVRLARCGPWTPLGTVDPP